MAKFRWYGKSTQGVNPGFLRKLVAAVRAAGGTGVYVISGKRTPATNTGVKNSNHLSGHAIDGDAIMADGSRVPLGTLLRENASAFGLRSGDQPGFYKGGPDPNHVDDGYNVRGGKPLPASGSTETAPVAASDQATQDTQGTSGGDPALYAAQQAQAGQIANIPQVGGAPLASAPLAGEGADTYVPQKSAAETWQLIASQGQVSQDTVRLAQLAGYSGNGTSTG